METHDNWQFRRAVTYGGSEREEWRCRQCKRLVVCTSLRGKRSCPDLYKACKCQK